MNTSISSRRYALFVTLLAAMMASSTSCDDARRHRASEDIAAADVKAPLPNDAAPADVAKELLDTFRALQHVRRTGLGTAEGKATYDQSMATIASLMARDMVYERLRANRSRMLPTDITPTRAVRLVTESWASMLAHYVDGFLIDDTLAARLSPDGSQVRITLEAEHPEERRKLDALRASGNAKDDEQLQAAALEQGFNVPIRARITLQLTQVDGAWRLSDVAVNVPRVPSRAGSVSRTIPPQAGNATRPTN